MQFASRGVDLSTQETHRANGIGAPRQRVEDLRLLTGQGRYAGDFFPNKLCHAALVRSPHAHARILSIDVSIALATQGVLAVLSGADAAADGLGAIPHNPDWTGPPDAELRLPKNFKVYLTENAPLPRDTVRYVGEAVVLVVAETAALASEAAELVEVNYAPLQPTVQARDAMAPDAPRLWPNCPNNLALTCDVGDRDATDRAFGKAAYTIALDSWIHRVTGSPMEPRAVVGEYDPARDHYTLRAGSGRGVVQTRERLALTLGVPVENCRAVFGDMGGNFGTRNAFTPEFALMPWAARRVGRPVKWTATRQECFLSDYQARDLTSDAELALDEEGNFLGLRGVNILNLGAYTVYFWPLRKGLSMMQSIYRIPAVHFEGHAVLTNTAPIAVYRSAGRPEAIFMIERLIDLAAVQCGFDRIELRHRNLITPDAMPFINSVGVTYDSGDYPACMAQALAAADWDGFAERRKESSNRGRCQGIGIANYIEVTSGIPRERVELNVCDDGTVEMIAGTMSSGQGHETSFPQLICEWLQIPFDNVRYAANDTDYVSIGGGSHSGRSMRLVSIAASEAVEALLTKGKKVAARILQASETDITYAEGTFEAPGGACVGLWEAAAASPNGLSSIGDITSRAGGYPYGSHVCEVEVDPETGQTEILRWTAVDDVGLAVNPLILHGQAHGAVAQGLGQALMETIHYDQQSAQLLTGSFMDYAIPRSITTPPIDTIVTQVPASSHPHGIRPGGEGGTTPALGVIINALVDALSDYGVSHIEMPATPQRVWQAIQSAKQR